MSRKKSPEPKAKRDPNALQLVSKPGKSHERMFAELSLTPEGPNAATARTYGRGSFGELDITECVEVMREKTAAVQAGDLAGIEATLTAQSVALDAIFTEMARRASLNMGQNLQATEAYMRLALKAQGQCRATLQTLADIKNPRPVAFVKQANIAHGPQQVNNGGPLDRLAPARAGNLESEQTKLLEASSDGEWMDTGAAGTAGRSDKEMATVGKVHWTQDARG